MNRTATALLVIPMFAIGISLFGGCGDTAQDGEATDTDTVTTDPIVSTPEVPPEGEVKTYTFHGKVTKIDPTTEMITIDHEKIGDYMEAMTMAYKVGDKAILDQVSVGGDDHLTFTLRVAGDQALITKVQIGHDEGEGH